MSHRPLTSIGSNTPRKEAWDKVTGKAKYTGDFYNSGLLFARLATSQRAHGLITSIDLSEAKKVAGVIAILLGRDVPLLCGPLLEDRPPLAIDKVRYYGEPLALVVALSEAAAALAASLIKVNYQDLPCILSSKAALATTAPQLHAPNPEYQKVVEDIYPELSQNLANTVYIRKGDLAKGWTESQVIIEANFSLPSTDHVALESHIAEVEIQATGVVQITTASQAPFTVKSQISNYFQIDEGLVQVHVPLVGGGFGGKAPVHLEILAYLASRAVDGRRVRLCNTREADFATSPSRLGLAAHIKLGATQDGQIKAAELLFHLDTGAYSDISPYMAKAIAVDCTGPYRINNLSCEVLCVYTNHNFATSFRGFTHESITFCIERTLDKLACHCNLDPLELRLKNAIAPGDTSPTQVKITPSNTGNLSGCLHKLKNLINWQEGTRLDLGNQIVRAKGISCLWKTPNPPTDASAGVLLTFNSDGSLNLNTGAVEMGSGSQSLLCQILAERLKMPIGKIQVSLGVNTLISPHYWKTVASMTNYLVGRAVLQAADDLISQIKQLGAIALKCDVADLEVANEKVALIADPHYFIELKDLVHGYKYPNGNALGGQIMGQGSAIMPHLTPLNRQTGAGKSGPAWTVGAQAIEIELDMQEFTYRILKAATVLDVGCLINPRMTAGSIRGGMSMGLSLASREALIYDDQGIMQNTSLRNYKLIHIGQEPEYLVDFIETPQQDAPFGGRAFSEHGIIGIPAALGNALSTAAQQQFDQLPLTPEYIWRTFTNRKAQHDTY
jgi:CO/xanthine dehydrogenase Mo-binding subunit